MAEIKKIEKVIKKVTLETNGLRGNVRVDGGIRVKDKAHLAWAKMGRVDIDVRNNKQITEVIELLTALKESNKNG